MMTLKQRQHPGLDQLALFSAGDLGMLERYSVAWHIRLCPHCRAELERFRDARQELTSLASEMPPGLDWDALALEMRGNIGVGLEAAECIASIDPIAPRSAYRWRPALALAGFAALAAGGWWLQTQRPNEPPTMQAAAAGSAGQAPVPLLLRATADSVRVERDGRGMELAHSDQAPVAVSVNLHGALGAQYLDEESGETTIYHVFAE